MITFNTDDIRFSLPARRKVRNWMKQSIENEMKLPGSVNFIFVSDEVLLKMNVQYLSHDSMTDVITFDYTEGSLISGDIFISIPRVRENAVTFAVPFIDELHRVMIHGVLHLMGYKDKTKSAKAIMSEKENFYLLNRW
ncbi:MAG: rRNA maturation RNase YbeY [Bacteroidetes bacterium GWE2_42_24]|nr:MAG: rRNA maturation RNase YbeY [Bacteroidetes bacterium GWE2_42_24]OFY27314.1 MAG: rRNA maturation RNase YbeY [Bacteroidetes bacterium GWF2_43_11]